MSQEYDPEWVEVPDRHLCCSTGMAKSADTCHQFEKTVGVPKLPDDPDGRREAFNAALVEFAKKLPATDPGIQTRQ